MSDAELNKVAQALTQAQRILVTSHPDPDGDAMGCTIAATLALEGMGKQATAYNPDPVPRRFRFLSGHQRCRQSLPQGATFDTTLVLDCSVERVLSPGALQQDQLGRLVVVDHHKVGGSLGHVRYVDPSAASVGVMLYRLFAAMQLDLTPLAQALFLTVMSDTGSYRYQNTNPEAMEVSARLLELGVNPWEVASRLYEDHPANEVKLLGLVLSTLEVSAGGACAALTVTEQMLADCGCTPDVVDGMINHARGVEGAQVALLLRPGADGAVRVSFRSRGAVDVSAVAAGFGGGGHHNAAGCTVQGTLEQVRARVFAAVQRVVGGTKP